MKSNYLSFFHSVSKITVLCILVTSISFAGWITKNERSFSLRNTSGTSGVNIYGDFNVTGAPILCVKNGTKCDWNYTGLLANADSMFLTDIPTSQIPLNSSSATLTIPSDANITKAYLYWNGHIHGATATQLAYDTATSGFNSVIFRTPDGVDHTITANANDSTKVNYYAYLNNTTNIKGFRLFYQATADVTDIVKNGGYASNKKTFTVGNIKTTAGPDSTMYEPEIAGNVTWGPMGGWSLIVEYVRPIASGQKYKNVSIYDGFKFLLPPTNQTESIDINISGFLTPLSQVPTGSMAFYAMGAEKQLTGEKVKLSNKSGTLQDVYNSINPVGSFLNDSISIFGTLLNSTRIYNPGIDLDVFDIKTSCKNSSGATVACIDMNQTSTILQLSVKNNNNTSDQSFPGMVAFSVDMYQPDISSFRKESNTTPTQALYPGDYVQYTLDLNNSGNEAAENITIYDTFSSSVGGDMLLDIIDRNATAIKNSIRLKTSSETNYHCAIGSTDPACASLLKDANCSVDYADNNISKATKVWCNVPYMAVNARELMKFSVKIRDDYDQTLSEQNVTNVAYTHYYNAATHEAVLLEGMSNINTAGTVGGLVTSPSLVDIVDTYNNNAYNYNVLDGLKTSIANISNKTLEAVFLGSNTSNPQPTIYSSASYDMLILFRLSNSTCTEDNPLSSTTDVTATFARDGNQYTAVSNSFTLVNQAKRNARIKAHFIDWNKVSLNLVGNNCTNNSSITGNLKGVPQCLNGNEDKIDDIIPYDVTECITAPTGKDAPCNSNAYTSTGSKGNIYPPKYNNAYGCLMCLSDKVNGSTNCSRDNFAIRPNDFNSTITANQQFIADQNTTISFYANQFNGTGTTDYNETVNSSFKVDVNISDSSKTCAASSIEFSPSIDFTNGLVTRTYSLPNVGDFNMTIHEISGSEYALVDADDTPDAQRFISSFTRQIKVVPNSFTIDGNFTNGGNGFTYLSNFETYPNPADRNISALLDLNISARSATNAILSNYTSLCYAKDANLTINTATVGNTLTGLNKLLWYDRLHDLNGSIALANISSYTMPLDNTQFDSTDANGTAQVQYLVNFDRNMSRTVQPFVFNISDINTSNEDDRTGTKTFINQSATYYYGRAFAPDYTFIGRNGIAAIYYEVYCRDCTATYRTTMGIDGNESVSAVNWYQNTDHNSTYGIVAPIPLQAAKFSSYPVTNGSVSISAQTLILQNSTNLPFTDTINLNSSNWLIYYPTYYTVSFISSGAWAGEGSVSSTNKVGATVDANTTGTTRTQKRIDW